MKPVTFVAIGICIAICASTSWAGQVWNAYNDYSESSNPAGAWSYMYSLVEYGLSSPAHNPADYTLLLRSDARYNGLYYWRTPNSQSYVWANKTGGDIGFFPTGWVAWQPSAAQAVVVRWTAPSAMTVDIQFDMRQTDVGSGDGTIFFVDQGSTTLFSAAYPVLDRATHTYTGSGVQLQAGQSLYFIVSDGGHNNINNDTDAFNISITQVPEPATLALLVIGGVAGLLRRRG